MSSLHAVPPIPMSEEEIAAASGSETDALLPADEDTTPGNPISRFYKRHRRLLMLLLVTVILLIIAIPLCVSKVESILLEAAVVNIERLEVVKFTDKGMHVNFKGSLSFEYGQVHNFVYHSLGLIAGSLAGSVASLPVGKSYLYVKTGNAKHMHHVSSFYFPEMSMSLVQGHISHLDMDILVDVIPTEVSVLLSEVMDANLRGEHDLEVSTRVVGRAEVRTLKVSRAINYDLGLDYTIPLSTGLQESLKIANLVVSESGEAYVTNATLLVEKLDMPLSLEIGQLNWVISLPGCHKMNEVSVLTTYPFTLKPYRELSLMISSTVDKLPADLTDRCNGSISVLNSIVRDFQDGENIQVVVSGSVTDPKMPVWLRELWSIFSIPLVVNSSMVQFNNAEIDVDAIDIHSVSLDIVKGTPLVSTSLTAEVAVPPEFKQVKRVNITSVRGDVWAMFGYKPLGRVRMSEWQTCGFVFNEDHVNVSLDLHGSSLHISDPRGVSRMLKNVVSGNAVPLDVCMQADIAVTSPILYTKLHNVTGATTFEVPALSPQDILNGTSVKIQQAYLVESNAQSVALTMDLSVANPLGIGMQMASQADLNLHFNGTKVGHVMCEGLHFEADGFSNLTTLLYLDTSAQKDATVKTEELVSEYLSGNRPLVTLVGHDNSFPDSELLSQCVDGVSLDVQLPEFVYEAPASVLANGFIVSSTMHVMTSEIEFTVYNPISNSEVFINIFEARAMYEGTTLGYINKETRLLVPPGLYKTPRIPITYASGGIGSSILRKAMNGSLKVQAVAVLALKLDKFKLDLVYHGSGLSANIRF